MVHLKLNILIEENMNKFMDGDEVLYNKTIPGLVLEVLKPILVKDTSGKNKYLPLGEISYSVLWCDGNTGIHTESELSK